MNDLEKRWIRDHLGKSIDNVIELLGDKNLLGRKLTIQEVMTGVVWVRGADYGAKYEAGFESGLKECLKHKGKSNGNFNC